MIKKIKILYEDANILAIEKPSGILVHPDEHSKEKTILDFFKEEYPKVEVVHRLDRETSGVMLLAKNKKAYEFLKGQFQTRTVKKIYNAIVFGYFKNERGVINKPIGRSPVDFRRHLAGRGARGELREAITEYKVLKEFTSPQPSPYKGEGEKFTYLEVKPKTGRTHQIRVHMKYISHPIACDSLYNPNGSCPKGLTRLALHSQSVEFKNLKEKVVKVESPLPLQFRKLIK